MPPIVDSDVAVSSPLVLGVPVPAVSVELKAYVFPLVSLRWWKMLQNDQVIISIPSKR